MKPLRLRLKGFTGIRDGLGLDRLSLDIESLAAGAQLVALVGPNGSGKTTVIDNTHPYRLMPSRATSASVGGFSYYDHLCAPEAGKDLEWLHEGRRFRSQLVFRMNGTRRTEAFLHEWRTDRWVPVVMPDGTRSDGKTDTYDRCVEGLLGSPETFFTSAFHAQNRRQLSAYRPGELKGLLVELLGLEQIRAAGQGASRVAAQLQQALEQHRAALARHRDAEETVRQLSASIEQAEAAIRATAVTKTTAQAELQAAQQQLAACEAERASGAGTEALRQSLLAQVAEYQRRKVKSTDARTRVVGELKVARDRAAATLREVVDWVASTQARHQRDSASAQALLARQQAIRNAVARLPIVMEQETQAREALRVAEQLEEREAQIRQRLHVVAASRQGWEREAGATALRAQQLRDRFHLTLEVPCSGMDLQGRCKLLADANEAKSLQPSADLKIAQVQQEVAVLDQERDKLTAELAGAGDAGASLVCARKSLDAVLEQRRVLHAEAALIEQVDRAEEQLKSIAAEAKTMQQRHSSAQSHFGQEQQRCDAAEHETSEQHAADMAELEASLSRLARQLEGLPPPFDDGKHAAAQQMILHARQGQQDAETAHATALTHRAELGGQLKAAQCQVAQGSTSMDRVAGLETELVLWTTLTKALGNDGVIALCIDDAGPTLASLTNELLLACYGPRFTVSITTQIETARKDVKEGFDVIVFDADMGTSKSVSLMSGGERLWIDEALTRAIAVYLAQSAGRRYQTLFSDEADGPLDPERKRMFMAMKREVLRVGGYEQEIFVSQTPELWSLADKVIDLTQLMATPAAQTRSLTI